jgi:uncharacterized phiE125 gp8 family phage protein
MWIRQTVPPPPTEPVTLAEAKRQCNVFHDDDDPFFGHLIAVARAHVEGYCSWLLGVREIDLVATEWSDLATFPLQPVIDVTAISFSDADGERQTVDDAIYTLRNGCVALVPGHSWPTKMTGSEVTVAVKVGENGVPAPVKHAMLLMISDMYERREPEPSIGRTTFDDILTNHRFY